MRFIWCPFNLAGANDFENGHQNLSFKLISLQQIETSTTYNVCLKAGDVHRHALSF